MTSNVSETITAILNEHFDIPTDADPNQSLDDAGLDSVAAVEFADILREQLGITLEEDELLVKETTLTQLTHLVLTKLEANA